MVIAETYRIFTGSASIKGFIALQKHIGQSTEIYRRSVSLRKSIARFWWRSVAITACASVLVGLLARPGLGVSIALWTLPVIALYLVFVRYNCVLLRDPDGTPVERISLANTLTAIRIFLVPPMLVLLFDGAVLWGLILYVVAAATDVADGVAARRLRQETALGLALDPVGDIVSTAAVFVFLWHRQVVPTWLLVALVIRYVQFFAGLAVLAVFGLTPKLSATPAGKIVGVVQATGIVILLAGVAAPEAIPFEAIRGYVAVVLGAAFCSVIVSQTVIGWRAVSSRTVRTTN